MTSIEALTQLGKEAERIMAEWKAAHMPAGSAVRWPLYTVQWDKRARRRAGSFRTQSKCSPCQIKITLEYFRQFGYERVLGTLKHELAHLIAWTLWQDRGHGPTFKQVCNQLGGTMNSMMAGHQYSHLATDQYTGPSQERKILYTCKCGVTVRRTRRFSEDQMYRRRCRKCNLNLTEWTCTVSRESQATIPSIFGGK